MSDDAFDVLCRCAPRMDHSGPHGSGFRVTGDRFVAHYAAEEVRECACPVCGETHATILGDHITRIDMRETMRQKLGVEFRRYQILGACNPKLALAALQADARVGAMLPCNVVLYEDDAGRAVLGAVDPMQSIGADGAPALREVAAEVRARLARVVDALA